MGKIRPPQSAASFVGVAAPACTCWCGGHLRPGVATVAFEISHLVTPHRSPMQAVTMMKIPRANNVVSTMTPMISSQREQKPRHSHTNAYMGGSTLH
jgi:hypothetical protein